MGQALVTDDSGEWFTAVQASSAAQHKQLAAGLQEMWCSSMSPSSAAHTMPQHHHSDVTQYAYEAFLSQAVLIPLIFEA
jgi:hypothetical protein